jgi:uncharacterized RDD family membrane protein YckC
LLDTTASIETPEHIEFHFQLAGPVRRGLAWCIDTLIRGLLLGVAYFFAGMTVVLNPGTLQGAKMGVLLLLGFVLEWGYFVACEGLMAGRSFGKRALGLRVVTEDGLPVRFGDSVLRNLVRAADFLPVGYVLGVVTMLLNPQFRRFGDLAAGTMVVFERRLRLRAPFVLRPAPTEQELAQFPASLDLRQSELEAIELLLRRSEDLAEARVEELADVLAPSLAKRLGLRYRNSARFLGLLYARSSGRR